MWVTKILISPLKIRIFCPKTTKFGIFVHFGPGLAGWCPVGGLVGSCGARAVSRKTPIYFICLLNPLSKIFLHWSYFALIVFKQLSATFFLLEKSMNVVDA